MKRQIFTICFLVGTLAAGTFSQSRTNRLFRPCPAAITPATVEIQRDGDIDLVPCSGKNILLNGSPLTGGFTVSGVLKTNSFPVFSTETNLAKSPFTWDGTIYIWENAAANSTFGMRLEPAVGAGSFIVGGSGTGYEINQANQTHDIRTASNLSGLDIDGDATFANNTAYLFSGDTQIGDVFTSGTGTKLRIRDSQANFQFLNSAGTATVVLSAVQSYTLQRTITAGGTTGDRTINQPSGTVNFAAASGTAGITVTNSTVTVNSIVYAIARTNDTTCSVKNVVPAAGSFVIRMTANCTAETSVGFMVTN